MKRLTLILAILICSTQMTYSQEEDGVVALALPVRNSLKFNRFVMNPTFSFVREQNKYISITNKREWVQFEDAPQTYLAGYSGRFGENIGAGLVLFQQNYGVLTTFGGVLNVAYNARLDTDSNLTFGLNLGAYKSGVNEGNVVTNFPDPSLDDVPSNFLLTVNPGINYGTAFLDFGVSFNNLVLYNINSSQIIEDNPEQSVQAHMMYTGYMESGGFFYESRFSGLLRSEFKKDKTVISGIAMLMVPKGIWAQVGYNNLYGASGGIGLNITKQIAIEYNFEKALGDLTEFGPSHEITLAFKLNNSENYDYSREDEVSSLISGDGRKPVSKISKIQAETNRQLAADAKAEAKLAAEVKLQAETEAKMKIDAENQAQAEEKAKAEIEAAKIAAEIKAKTDAESKIKAEQDAQAKLEAEKLAKEVADAKAKIAAENKARAQQEENARIAAEQKIKAEQEAKVQLEEQARLKAEAQAKLVAESKAKEEAKLAEQAKAIALEKAKIEAQEKETARLEAEKVANAKLVEQARLIAENKVQEEAEAKLAEIEAQAITQAQNEAKLANEAKAKAEQERKEATTETPKGTIGKSMESIEKLTEQSKTQQEDLLKRFNEAVTNKNKDLKDLKEENDLSDKGIFTEPKPFKSVTAENNAIEALKSDIDEVIKERNERIKELEDLLDQRERIATMENDTVNLYYQKAIKKLKAEQLQTVQAKATLSATLEGINEATEIERKRRIKRAAYDNEQDRYLQDKATLSIIKQNTPLSPTPIKEEDFDFGEEQSNNIEILKNVQNVENGYYMIVAVHNDKEKRDDFLRKAVASGRTDINFFYDVSTSKYYIYYQKFDSIEESNEALKSKGSRPYNGKLSIIKIEN